MSLVMAIRSLLFTIVFIPSVVLWGTLISLSFPLSFHARFRLVNVWVHLMLFWLRVTCGIRHEVTGLENLPAEGQPAIVMAKHQSTWETIAFQAIFPPLVWVLKQELLKLPFFGWGLQMLKSIAIDRSAGRKAVVQVVKQGIDRLQMGLWVVIFPEGTRVAPGRRGRYKLGGAMLAAKSGYPVVPVAHNAGEHWPKRMFKKRPGVIRVSIGPIIETEGRKADEILSEVENWIESEMPNVSSGEYRGELLSEG